MKDVAVIGCGPAGLFAAWAVINRGHRVTIIGDPVTKPNSDAAGVFVLHGDMDLPLRSTMVDIIPSGGDEDDYRTKVYGATPGAGLTTSFPGWRDQRQFWDGRQGIDLCWDIVHSAATFEQRRIGSWAELEHLTARFDGIISTIPLSALFQDAEGFLMQTAWVYRGVAPADEAYMMYNANPTVPWYRASAVWGAFALEYRYKPDDSKMYVPVRKVISRPGNLPLLHNMLFTGRFGAWDKKKLSNSAYDDTMTWLA